MYRENRRSWLRQVIKKSFESSQESREQTVTGNQKKTDDPNAFASRLMETSKSGKVGKELKKK